MRLIVELCHKPLIQTFLFLIERFEFVTLAPRRAIPRGWRRYWFRLAQSQLVDNLSATSQIRRKDQPILAPSQRTIENAEFLLIIKLGSEHLITGHHLFLSIAPHFRSILTRTSDKNVIAMHRPRDGAQITVEAATRHGANGETATDEPFFSTSLLTMLQLGESRTTPCAASQHALSRIRQVHSPATQTKVSLFTSA